MRGRKPKPTALKLITGSRRVGDADPHEIPVEIPAAPGHLYGAGLAEWHRITRELADAGLITKFDQTTLSVYCEAWHTYLQAQDMLRRPADQGGGHVVMLSNGCQGPNPWVSIANRACERLLKIAVEFGFSPSSRTRVQGMRQLPLLDDDPMEALIRAGKNLPPVRGH